MFNYTGAQFSQTEITFISVCLWMSAYNSLTSLPLVLKIGPPFLGAIWLEKYKYFCGFTDKLLQHERNSGVLQIEERKRRFFGVKIWVIAVIVSRKSEVLNGLMPELTDSCVRVFHQLSNFSLYATQTLLHHSCLYLSALSCNYRSESRFGTCFCRNSAIENVRVILS